MTQEHRRQMKAAVMREPKAPFQFEDIYVGTIRDDEVLVRIVASGVCHTDIMVRNQDAPVPLPAIAGHEGAGVVEAVGAAVTEVKPGDHVVLSYMSCGHCKPCISGHPAHCAHVWPINFGGSRLDGSTGTHDAHGHVMHDHFFGQSSFAEYSVANERNVVKVPDDLPLELLAPLGCGIETGAGGVLNALKVRPGSSFAAFGAGAVGLSAVMAARVAGATTIIAVDVNADRLKLALELGATHSVNSREGDPVGQIRAITGGGLDYSLECSGRKEVLRQAIDALGSFGTCGIIGATRPGTEASFDINDVMAPSKRIMGIVQGDAIPKIFIPALIELFRQGRFPFDRLIRYYDFVDINQAIEDSESGRTIKPVLRIGKA
ncbi:NAD(P)-dependent alcohol dehydrogenase [Paraburkholderia sp. LEh10]|uniref:NAD(P)-dependent alcohol dehydrogenase n=1 Tax=Paraburkholderia sp. LEh10 TaxID=2821353 RepID=UPI001AE9F81F|nr:NAD(P)-dependent alcohol dehydrogenase [Paraburkholderia sp. LEh10]MBP0590423.1 NAD(P)-dependent alcohol dehydrogenase [Paraburkholderia sp. LEh10]